MLKGTEEPSSSDERFSPRAHQFNIYPKSRHVSSDGLLRLSVDSTYNSSQLYLDLWWGQQWLSTQTIKMRELNPNDKIGGLKSTGDGVITIPTLNAKVHNCYGYKAINYLTKLMK